MSAVFKDVISFSTYQGTTYAEESTKPDSKGNVRTVVSTYAYTGKVKDKYIYSLSFVDYSDIDEND